MHKMLKSVVFCSLIILSLTSLSFADRRSYVWTYEYSTLPQKAFELENYLTFELPRFKASKVNTIKPQVELEYGLTNNFDLALYQMFSIENGESKTSSKYDGFKLRARYRFGHRGEYPLDPLVYLEYIRGSDFSQPNSIEAKLVLGKDIGDFNLTYNQILERNLENKGKTEPEYSVGLGYKFSRALRLGVETKGSYTERECALGPTVSWENNAFWVSLGAAFGLNERTDDLQTRIIVGVHF